MKKALTAAVLLLITSIITALLPWIADRDPAMAVFRAREAERAPDPDVLDNLRTTSTCRPPPGSRSAQH